MMEERDARVHVVEGVEVDHTRDLVVVIERIKSKKAVV
jgi:hypothetical protein